MLQFLFSLKKLTYILSTILFKRSKYLFVIPQADICSKSKLGPKGSLLYIYIEYKDVFGIVIQEMIFKT